MIKLQNILERYWVRVHGWAIGSTFGDGAWDVIDWARHSVMMHGTLLDYRRRWSIDAGLTFVFRVFEARLLEWRFGRLRYCRFRSGTSPCTSMYIQIQQTLQVQITVYPHGADITLAHYTEPHCQIMHIRQKHNARPLHRATLPNYAYPPKPWRRWEMMWASTRGKWCRTLLTGTGTTECRSRRYIPVHVWRNKRSTPTVLTTLQPCAQSPHLSPETPNLTICYQQPNLVSIRV